MKVVYCANCGKRLPILRKALPAYSTIIDIVQYHECLSEPVPFDLTPIPSPPFVQETGKNKFVQKMNNLPRPGTIGTDDLRDRRTPEQVKSEDRSTAPNEILAQLKAMQGIGND